jgi:hypothetical protein
LESRHERVAARWPAQARRHRDDQHEVRRQADVVVTHYEDGRSFELESTALPGTRMAIRATMSPSGNGSVITQGFEPRGLLAPIVGPMMSGQILKTFSAVLNGLKEKVETA